jgi:mutator protein MutT
MLPPADKPRVDAAIAIVVRDDNLILVSRRRADDTLGGYWEFPGGKCEDGETLEACVVRELREELDLAATPFRKLDPIEHDYPHMLLRLHPFLCRYESGEMKFLECETACWIRPADLRNYRFPPANDQLIDDVIALLAVASA